MIQKSPAVCHLTNPDVLFGQLNFPLILSCHQTDGHVCYFRNSINGLKGCYFCWDAASPIMGSLFPAGMDKVTEAILMDDPCMFSMPIQYSSYQHGEQNLILVSVDLLLEVLELIAVVNPCPAIVTNANAVKAKTLLRFFAKKGMETLIFEAVGIVSISDQPNT